MKNIYFMIGFLSLFNFSVSAFPEKTVLKDAYHSMAQYILLEDEIQTVADGRPQRPIPGK